MTPVQASNIPLFLGNKNVVEEALLRGKQSPNTGTRSKSPDFRVTMIVQGKPPKSFAKFIGSFTKKHPTHTTRGLDIPAVDLVVQLDGPPTDPKVFLHRCIAVLFLSPEEYIDFLAV